MPDRVVTRTIVVRKTSTPMWARLLIAGGMLLMVLPQFYDGDLDGVPFISCSAGGVSQAAPDGKPAGGATGVAAKAGAVFRDLEAGPPSVAGVTRAVNDGYREAGRLVGVFTAAAKGAAAPVEPEPDPAPGVLPAGACDPCPTTVLPAAAAADADGIDPAARAILRAGWAGDDAVTALAIGGAESRYKRRARNPSGASGLMQMMLPMHAGLFPPGTRWDDLGDNAAAAHKLWTAEGWDPWTTWRNGDYRAHLAEARAAIDRLTVAGDPAGTVTPASATSSTPNGLRPVAAAAADLVRSRWGDVRIDGYADRNIGSTGRRSKHADGLAIDVFPTDADQGRAIFDYFAGPGYTTSGADNVIYSMRIFNRGRGLHDYDVPPGGSPHYDHVHIDFHDQAPRAAAPAPSCSSGGSLSVVAPVAATDRRNYGRSGSRWAREHTGTDFSASCGTPVVAATAGTVRVDTSASWAGRWLVKVETGPASLTTWYAHMQALDVTDGQTVRAGQQLGEVGAEGNATGCHLHFEVHPRNGSIYADGVDPTRWLARKVGRASSVGTLPASWSTIAGGDSFALATFNIRGASHTGAASADRRIVHAVDVIARHRVDVIGLQEAQGRQVRAFDKLTGGAFARWGSGDNQVAWRRAAFTLADGVATRLVRVPYFGGHGRDMPAVRLVDRAGRASWFLSVHNPSSKTHRGNQDRWRREALAIELRAVRQLAGYGDPVYLVGDMNEKAEFGRRARAAGMVSATSWAYRGIDWITGSPGTRFSRTVVDDSRQVDAATDHPIVVTRAAAADDTIMGGFRP